jgi:murein DD-endopeptidase MepM/ murein hydrolase activator NlpD
MIAVVLVALLSLPATPACYLPPVDAVVVDPFRAPACRYCAGHRGLEYRPSSRSPVVAAAGGHVQFAGVVAGVRYLVIAHGDGLLATYGYLQDAVVSAGQEVRRGQILGHAGSRLYFGVRQDGEYVDPAPLLGRWRFRPRLIPANGSAPARRATTAPTLHCATSVTGR